MYPKLISLGPLTLYTYGFLLAVAFFFGLWLTARFARREGIHEDTIWNLGLLIVVCGLLGSKLLMIVTEWNYYRDHPAAIFSLSTLQSAGVFFGGLLCALAGCAWYFRRHHLPPWKMADLFAPGLALGHAIGRLGCFSAGCCFGRPASVPWAVIFTDPVAGEQTGVPLHLPLHPTQLYESAAETLIFLLLLGLRRRKSYEGHLILTYLALYSVARFIIEFYRGDERGSLFGGLLSTSQFISIITFCVAILTMIVRARIKLPAAAVPSSHVSP